MALTFIPRSDLSAYEWDERIKEWNRPRLDRGVLNELSKRNTFNGLWRVGVFIVFLAASAAAAVYVSRYSIWLAILPLYLYYFFFGFWVAIAHELQHKTVFARGADWFSEILFFFVQVLIWNGPRYARISHRLHHRFTMVHSVDPETDWPRVIDSRWLRRYFWGLILKILVVGAVIELIRDIAKNLKRVFGINDAMMREFCSPRDIVIIRVESLFIILIHAAVITAAVLFRRWELLAFVTIAWHIGNPIEFLWHQTEHIGRLYNVNDQRLCTRSIRVSPFIRLIFWGLDDHVDHHLYPGIPSRNLPKLHRILAKDLPEPKNIFQCWREMFAIAREKDRHPENEFVPIEI